MPAEVINVILTDHLD